MKKFVKVFISNNRENINVWRLVIENEADLFEYAKYDNNLNASAWISQDRSKHPSGRAAIMEALLEAKALTKTINPIVTLNELFTLKTENMLKLLDKGYTICVNEMGGYCDLEGYLSRHNANIVETIIKDDYGFPLEKEVINSEVLILENDSEINEWLLSYLKKENITNYQAILRLREVDLKYTIEAIKNAKTIIIHSEFMDNEQVTSFLKLFSTIEKKNVILSTSGTDFSYLTENSFYSDCAEKHNITFI